MDSNTIIVGNFNTSLTPMDRSSKQKINKETQALNDAVDQIDLIDIFRTFHPKTADYTSFPSAHGTFSRIDLMLAHKSSLSKFKKIEFISSIFSDHNAMRLEMNYRASLVAQWLRVCLLMQGTRVRALAWEDPTCRGAAGPVSHNC